MLLVERGADLGRSRQPRRHGTGRQSRLSQHSMPVGRLKAAIPVVRLTGETGASAPKTTAASALAAQAQRLPRRKAWAAPDAMETGTKLARQLAPDRLTEVLIFGCDHHVARPQPTACRLFAHLWRRHRPVNVPRHVAGSSAIAGQPGELHSADRGSADRRAARPAAGRRRSATTAGIELPRPGLEGGDHAAHRLVEQEADQVLQDLRLELEVDIEVDQAAVRMRDRTASGSSGSGTGR